MLKIINKISEWNSIRNSYIVKEKSLGFIPTMGALHKGHISLIEKSVIENELTVVSIFINPTQFNNPTDLINYPVSLEQDVKILERYNADFLFYPWYNEIYPDGYHYKICETNYSNKLCGAFRPGHFEGVLTVVMKLLNIIKPNRAYFGEKDYQQYKLIKEMCSAFFMDVEIIPCPTVRDADGLALSSRNLLLTENERNIAKNFPHILQSEFSCADVITKLEKLGLNIEYIEEEDGKRFGAINIGNVRLIDNVNL